MGVADEQGYEEMINALQNFLTKAEENCNVMRQAAQDCVDNTEDDDNAKSLEEMMNTAVGKIEENFDSIDSIISALEEELERLQEIRAKVGLE